MSNITKSNNSLQVIVAAMHQKDYSIIERMNLRSDALICNQGTMDSREVVKRNGSEVIFINSTQRGVGRNRNSGIINSSGDILLFADEDVCYYDNYVEVVKEAYERNPRADMIMFNIKRINDSRSESRDLSNRRVRWHSSLRYGASRITVRRSSLLKANVWFSLLFGGGAPFGFGEDCLFVSDCIKKGLKVYASEEEIGVVDQINSTWFTGYDDQYFKDKGTLFAAISNHLFPALSVHYLLRHRNEYRGRGIKKTLDLMLIGRGKYLNNRT